MNSTLIWSTPKLLMECINKRNFLCAYHFKWKKKKKGSKFDVKFCCICCRGEANKYSEEELFLMKSQDIGYILQKVLSEKKVDWCTNRVLLLWSEMLYYTLLKPFLFIAENRTTNCNTTLTWFSAIK